MTPLDLKAAALEWNAAYTAWVQNPSEENDTWLDAAELALSRACDAAEAEQ